MSDLWARHITIWNDTEKISMAPCARMTRITWVDTPIWGSFFFSQTTKYYTTWQHLDHPSIPSRKLPEVVDIYPYLHPLFYLDMHASLHLWDMARKTPIARFLQPHIYYTFSARMVMVICPYGILLRLYGMQAGRILGATECLGWTVPECLKNLVKTLVKMLKNLV